jgi:hypothetical protein
VGRESSYSGHMARKRVLLLAAGFALALTPAVSAKKPKTVKVKTQAEIEEYTPRQPGTAQVFTAKGGVGASKAACRFGRRVEVHQIDNGVDTVVAVVRTFREPGSAVEGTWSATWTTPPRTFSFVIEVTQRDIPKKRVHCNIGGSRLVTLP